MRSSAMPIGIDIIEISRIKNAVSRWRDAFLKRIYTEEELEYCRDMYPSLATRFAAKESVMKALNTGFTGISWRDIEILNEKNDVPLIRLYGNARQIAEEKGVEGFSISMSHCEKYAIALVVGHAA